MDKIIKIDSEDEINALEEAKEEFYDKELESEYLDDREVIFEENKFIPLYAKEISNSLYDLYKDKLNYNDVKAKIESSLGINEFSDYVLEESLNILTNEYNLSLKSPMVKDVRI